MVCGRIDATTRPRGRSASRSATATVATAFPVTRETTTCPVYGPVDPSAPAK